MKTCAGHFTLAAPARAWLWALALVLAACRLEASDAAAVTAPGTNQPDANQTGGPAAAGSGDRNALDDNYKMAIGDHLSFQIVEDGEDPKTLVVTDSGELEVPYIGRYAAAGRTCKELAVSLKAALEKDYYYHATVIIAVDTKARMASKGPGKVYLAGAVHLVGQLEMPVDENLTLYKAILRMGGFSDFADKRHVKVTRTQGSGKGANKVFTVNVAEIMNNGKPDLPLEPEDVIFIPDKVFRM